MTCSPLGSVNGVNGTVSAVGRAVGVEGRWAGRATVGWDDCAGGSDVSDSQGTRVNERRKPARKRRGRIMIGPVNRQSSIGNRQSAMAIVNQQCNHQSP